LVSKMSEEDRPRYSLLKKASICFIILPMDMEGYRSGHNELDSKCVGLSGSCVVENLDFMRFLLPLEFE
jgi:hypothetical protein